MESHPGGRATVKSVKSRKQGGRKRLLGSAPSSLPSGALRVAGGWGAPAESHLLCTGFRPACVWRGPGVLAPETRVVSVWCTGSRRSQALLPSAWDRASVYRCVFLWF